MAIGKHIMEEEVKSNIFKSTGRQRNEIIREIKKYKK